MAQYQPTITKEAIAELPVVAFEGEIVVVDTPELLAEACKYLLKQPILGFDTESRPSFQKGVVNRIALLQLSTVDRCYLFRLCKIRLDKSILKILENRNITKIGLSVDGDIRELSTLGRFRPKGFVDLQKIVGGYGIQELSLLKIVAIVLGRRISKAQRLSNWEAVQLTEAQRVYAATDAWVCTEIYNRLQNA
jgi:ribonuclease D